MVLLDMLANGGNECVVAHVDHGIRHDSSSDARFVEGLARHYGMPFELHTLALGGSASEQAAREARYAFLCEMAKKYDATLVTAHHGDDLVETIVLNVWRGTGWRGLAVLNRPGIERPLLGYSKGQLYEYALKHGLEWVEDSTNRDHRYLRNKLRAKVRPHTTDTLRRQLKKMRDQQVSLKRLIKTESTKLLTQNKFSRHLLINIDHSEALELLRAAVELKSGRGLERPQLERLLVAMKTAKAGTMCQAGGKTTICFSARFFSVEVL